MNFDITQDLAKSLFEYRDGDLFWKVSPCNKVKVGSRAGRTGNHGYRQVGVSGKIYLVHRVIFLMHHGYLPEFLDHIDCNKINNRIENLREATRFQNQCNRRFVKNSSGIKGVVWHKNNKNWMVQINVNGAYKYIGSFKDLELAELVATEARAKYHMDFARDK